MGPVGQGPDDGADEHRGLGALTTDAEDCLREASGDGLGLGLGLGLRLGGLGIGLGLALGSGLGLGGEPERIMCRYKRLENVGDLNQGGALRVLLEEEQEKPVRDAVREMPCDEKKRLSRRKAWQSFNQGSAGLDDHAEPRPRPHPNPSTGTQPTRLHLVGLAQVSIQHVTQRFFGCLQGRVTATHTRHCEPAQGGG